MCLLTLVRRPLYRRRDILLSMINQPSGNESKFKVAICGGGISGLCLAVILAQSPNITVAVYESASRFKEIGAGVMIWSRTWKILEALNLDSEFSQIAHAPPDGSMGVGFDYRRSDQRTEGFRFHLVQMPYGCIRFHRAHFLDVLVNHLPRGVAHFGKRVVEYEYTNEKHLGEITLLFADGTKDTCNVLVGCDGVKSTIRSQLYREEYLSQPPNSVPNYDPVFTGTIAYRGLVPVEQLCRANKPVHRTVETPMMYCGKGKHVVSYSISQGSLVNVVTFASEPEKEGTEYCGDWVSQCSQAELLDCYDGWEPEVADLLKCVETPSRWALHHLRPLPYYVRGRVALIGDAAHAMAPHQGAGAGQAIEDAFVLGKLLMTATASTLEEACKAYENIRLPLANAVLRGSQESGGMYEFNSEYGDDYAQLGPAIEHQWDWIALRTPEEDVERALKCYHSLVS
ncbi:FAD/NAD-P-binding domain-containing protein [Hymenopellis radicata]|nr:FAD/NAD-P-binding domain-containing protein [Hymenopellis radicata]